MSLYVLSYVERERLTWCSNRWHDAIRTLAKLHRVDVSEAGLASFGKANGFYDRQIKTFGTISAAQASTVDVETKKPVGQIPHIEEILGFFRDKRYQPKDRGTLVHGDYKIDNLVFHKTEPRVIGILEYVYFHNILFMTEMKSKLTSSLQLGNVNNRTSPLGSSKHSITSYRPTREEICIPPPILRGKHCRSPLAIRSNILV